jgi:hypothetical protein
VDFDEVDINATCIRRINPKLLSISKDLQSEIQEIILALRACKRREKSGDVSDPNGSEEAIDRLRKGGHMADEQVTESR